VLQTRFQRSLPKISVEDIRRTHGDTTYNDRGLCSARKLTEVNMTKLPEHTLAKMALSNNPGDRRTQLFIVMVVVLGLAWILVRCPMEPGPWHRR
jgi:hypothetical protein